ncbi:hypothetical protein JOB18_037606 [Solea senegalensis]|uniref:Secreted protein n=1 Tax=Solea senegalensis TaxID=28829 RepID=A0AAV6SFD9_SOLSE|nr:hypothetical protein JOB18_037606 [Solea senegalensis]
MTWYIPLLPSVSIYLECSIYLVGDSSMRRETTGRGRGAAATNVCIVWTRTRTRTMSRQEQEDLEEDEEQRGQLCGNCCLKMIHTFIRCSVDALFTPAVNIRPE